MKGAKLGYEAWGGLWAPTAADDLMRHYGRANALALASHMCKGETSRPRAFWVSVREIIRNTDGRKYRYPNSRLKWKTWVISNSAQHLKEKENG